VTPRQPINSFNFSGRFPLAVEEGPNFTSVIKAFLVPLADPVFCKVLDNTFLPFGFPLTGFLFFCPEAISVIASKVKSVQDSLNQLSNRRPLTWPPKPADTID
jgi:hypothetical protein